MPAREDGPAIFNSGGTWREGQSAGRYTGTVTVTNGSRLLGNIAVVLYVRGFTLPSTSSLPTAFGVSIDHVCLAHGDASGPWCANGNPDFHLWSRLYGRFLLDHRVTLLLTDVPNPSDWTATQNRYAADYGGLIDGTDPGQRLSGAKMTTVVYPWFNGSDTASAAVSRMSQWVSFTKNRGWFSRTYHYARPDEPGPNCANWSPIIDQGTWAHGVDPDFRVMVTGNMADYNECNAGSAVNWPNFMVDATGVQNRAEPWMHFIYGAPGMLYWDIADKLPDAWRNDGIYDFTGQGDGTLVYPGTPATVMNGSSYAIGGVSHIPVASYRLKMIREGLEDYEYLTLCNAIDPAKAMSIARGLLPMSGTGPNGQPTGSMYSANDYPNATPAQFAANLDAARSQLAQCIAGPTSP